MGNRVIIWGINYAPEVVGIAVYTTGLAQFLQESGLDVTVVSAFRYYPEWNLQETCPLYASDRVAGVRIERCLLYVPRTPNVLRRIAHEMSFAVSSFVRLLFLPRADVYIVISPPLVLGFFAAVISLIKSSKFILHVQDLQPDASAALGMLKQGLFYKCLKLLEKLSYSRATIVTCISDQMREKISLTTTPPEKVFVFPNWTQELTPQTGWKMTANIEPDKFVVSYSGNMGFKQGLDIIVEAARQLSHRLDIVFVLGGDGSQKASLMKLAQGYNLENVIFQGLLDENMHTAMLCETDVFVVPQKPGSGAIFFPSKLLKALFLGRPVITNADTTSALHQALLEGGFGLIVSPTDTAAFARAIEDLCTNKQLRQQLGKKGIAYAERFRCEKVLPQFLKLVLGVQSSVEPKDLQHTR